MSEERAVQVVVLDGLVSRDEMAYRQAWLQYATTFEQIKPLVRQISESRQRLIEAWFAEHYPGVLYRTESRYNDGDFGVLLFSDVTVYSTDQAEAQRIAQELKAYFKTLRATL